MSKTATRKDAPAVAKEPPPSWADKTLGEMDRSEILAAFPAKPDKPLAEYSVEDLVRLKRFGPAVIGGELYLASQAATQASADNRFGPAILSKDTKTIPYLTSI